MLWVAVLEHGPEAASGPIGTAGMGWRNYDWKNGSLDLNKCIPELMSC